MTTTTHKSLRGPRGGLILSKAKHAKAIDASVFPGLQGGPHMNQVAATALTLKLAAAPDFRTYARAVLANAQALAQSLRDHQVHLITGGTENHLLVIDTVASFGIDGRQAQEVLDRIELTTNKQVIPDDPNPPMRPSGLRLGTPAPTARGMGEADMAIVGRLIASALRSPENAEHLAGLAEEVSALTARFPVPGL